MRTQRWVPGVGTSGGPHRWVLEGAYCWRDKQVIRQTIHDSAEEKNGVLSGESKGQIGRICHVSSGWVVTEGSPLETNPRKPCLGKVICMSSIPRL